MGIENYWAFILSVIFFTLTPGIDTIFILNKSISQGREAGFYALLGISSGLIVHTLLAALGLSVILAKSATAFMIVKYVGAAYLVYMGVVKMFTKKHLSFTQNSQEKKIKNTNKNNFLSGVLTNILNPKVALFFLAFFPQFIRHEAIENPLPFIVLGATFAFIGCLWFIILILFTSLFSEKLANHPYFSKWMDKASGLVFILLGLKVALTDR